MLRGLCIWLFCLMAGAAAAADYPAGPDDYRGYLQRLQPGDRLLLEPGDYRRGLPLHNLEGLPGKPIVVEAARPSRPPRFIARPGANTVSLLNVRHVVVRHLELDGANVPVDAVKAEGHSRYADFVTLEQLHIHDHGASQQNVGISTKCPSFGWVVRDNLIERVGTGMYFGDSDGSDPFVAGVIEGNRIRETLGYNLQIKHQKARPPEHGGRHDTVIRHNFFSKEARSSTAPVNTRPNALLGHLPLAGQGEGDRYIVYNNFFYQNPDEALFQAEGNLVIFGNVFVNTLGSAIRIQPHNDVPKTVHVFNNTVVSVGEGISIRNRGPSQWTQLVFANLIFAGHPLSGGVAVGNHLGKYEEAGRFLRTPSRPSEVADLLPRQALRYQDVQIWPELPLLPTGIDGNALVAGEIGAVTSSSAGTTVRLPGAEP